MTLASKVVSNGSAAYPRAPQLGGLVDSERGLVSRRIFHDEEIYQRELEQIFGRCWLFLGHESMIPNPGDYIAAQMGEDPVLVCRDQKGTVRAFLNTCLHRGNRVCLFDSGNARAFTCQYHGWSYNTEGKLTGVPFAKEAYYGEIDRESLALRQVARLATYGGLIFATWDAGAESLDAYLGEARWYLDKLFLADDMGGLEVLPGRQQYLARGNWKIPAENFAGDHYHTLYTHGSAFKLGLNGRWEENDDTQRVDGPFEMALSPGHGLGGVYTGAAALATHERDLARAEGLGPEVVEYVKERFARLQERLKDSPAKPFGFSHGNIFPNFSLQVSNTFLRARGLFLWLPKGPDRLEARGWAAVERDAPKSVKEIAAQGLHQGQSASGLFLQDDYENFERVTENTKMLMARDLPFQYTMGLGYEGQWPGQETWDIQGLPGLVGPRFSEHAQRLFYRYWAARMELHGE